MVIVANDLEKAVKPIVWLTGYIMSRIRGNYFDESITQGNLLLDEFVKRFDYENRSETRNPTD